MLGGTYSTGTIAVDTDSTTVSGVDVLWNDVLEGDELWPSGHGAMIIGADVVHPFDAIELLTPWPGTSLLGSTYVIVKTSWKRHDVTELQKLWRTLAAELEATGNFIYVEGDEPDPEMGENGQFALKTNIAPWRLWLKEVNVWNEQAIPVGSIWRGTWSAATTYTINDVVGRNGNSYISVTADNLNKPPESNPADWNLVSAAGSTGADGGVITIPYLFSTTTAMADPGSGKLRLNNATQNAATALALDLIDNRGFDFTLVLASAFGTTNPVRGHIRIHKATDTTKFLTLAISSETSPTGFKQYVCSVIGSSGATPFVDLDAVVVNIDRAGDRGAQGIQGIQGIQGPIGNPGGAIALPYVVDGLATMDSDPGAGKMRFNASPQQAATVLRFSDTTSLGAPVGNQFDAIATSSTSVNKVTGRVYVNGGTAPRLSFRVTAVEAKLNYHNLTITVVSASVPDPFANGASIVVDWTPVGDKGDAATATAGTTTTLAPSLPATVTNVGTVNAAVFNFGIPQGVPGQAFAPTYVVPLLADRAPYDDDPVFYEDGQRLSVLVESDTSNSNLPTLYFKQSNAPAVWSEGVTFQAAGAADAVTYDNTASGYAATDVQDALDESAVIIAANNAAIPGKVAKTGDTMTGHLTLPISPGAANAVRKDYADTKVAKTGDTMTGLLTLSGNPTAALHAAPKQYVDALGTAVTVPLGGGTSFDIQVPANTQAVRVTGIIIPTSANVVNPFIQVSLVSSVFRTSTADYLTHGFVHATVSTPTNVIPVTNNAVPGITLTNSNANAGISLHFDGTILLKRPATSLLFTGDFRALTFNAGGAVHSFMHTYVQPAAGTELTVLALRIVSSTGDNWATGSFVKMEWM